MTAVDNDNPLAINADGWCDQALHRLSPNCDPRPADLSISLLVVHNISLPAGKYGSTHVSDLFCNLLDYNADPSF